MKKEKINDRYSLTRVGSAIQIWGRKSNHTDRSDLQACLVGEVFAKRKAGLHELALGAKEFGSLAEAIDYALTKVLDVDKPAVRKALDLAIADVL